MSTRGITDATAEAWGAEVIEAVILLRRARHAYEQASGGRPDEVRRMAACLAYADWSLMGIIDRLLDSVPPEETGGPLTDPD